MLQGLEICLGAVAGVRHRGGGKVPAAIGETGISKVVAVADGLANAQTPSSNVFHQSFLARVPQPAVDYVHLRMQLLIEALAKAIK